MYQKTVYALLIMSSMVALFIFLKAFLATLINNEVCYDSEILGPALSGG